MKNLNTFKIIILSTLSFILSSCRSSNTDREIMEILVFNEWINYQKYSYRPETVICVEYDHEISKFQKEYMKKLHVNTFTKDDCPNVTESTFKTNMRFNSPQPDSTGTMNIQVFEYCGSLCGTNADFIISKYQNNWFVQKIKQGPIS